MTIATQQLFTQIEFGSRTFWALLPIFVLVLAVVGYALVDLLRARHVRFLPKAVWAFIILVVSAPLGALAYLFLGRTHHEADRDGQPSAGFGDPVPEQHRAEGVSLTGRRLSRYERGIRL